MGERPRMVHSLAATERIAELEAERDEAVELLRETRDKHDTEAWSRAEAFLARYPEKKPQGKERDEAVALLQEGVELGRVPDPSSAPDPQKIGVTRWAVKVLSFLARYPEKKLQGKDQP